MRIFLSFFSAVDLAYFGVFDHLFGLSSQDELCPSEDMAVDADQKQPEAELSADTMKEPNDEDQREEEPKDKKLIDEGPNEEERKDESSKVEVTEHENKGEIPHEQANKDGTDEQLQKREDVADNKFDVEMSEKKDDEDDMRVTNVFDVSSKLVVAKCSLNVSICAGCFSFSVSFALRGCGDGSTHRGAHGGRKANVVQGA